MSRRAGLTCLEAIVALVLMGGFWLMIRPTFLFRERSHTRTKCSNNLRQLGLAAIQYADDKRFFPHAGPKGGLMSGPEGNGPTKVVRTLLWFGYHDNPEGWICPSSYDLYLPITDGRTKQNMRRWYWAQASIGEEKVSPFQDGLPDPALDATDELSYGWSRRYMNTNQRSTSLLSADRAQRSGDPDQVPVGAPPGKVGNHVDGANVMQVDATVNWVTSEAEEAPFLTATEGKGGFLAMQPLGPPNPAAAAAAARAKLLADLRREGLAYGPIVLLALGLFVGWFRTRPRPGDAPMPLAAGAVAPVRPSRVEALPPDARAVLKLGQAAPAPGAPVVLQVGQRCPCCHAEVGLADALTRCLDCQAVFHAECVGAGGTCPTLGCGTRRG